MKNRRNYLIDLLQDLENHQIEKIIDDIEKTKLSDGTAEFWRAYPELLEQTERWDFDYSDMGYVDRPQY